VTISLIKELQELRCFLSEGGSTACFRNAVL